MLVRKIALTILYIFLILVLLYDLIYICRLLAGERRSDGITYFALFISFSACIALAFQSNIIMLFLLLTMGIKKKFKTAIFNTKLYILFLLNFIAVGVTAYSQLKQLLELSQFAYNAQMHYGLHASIINKHTFLSKIYLMYGLGWYKLTTIFNYIFHSVSTDESMDVAFPMIVCLNLILSTLLLICFSTCFHFRRNNNNK